MNRNVTLGFALVLLGIGLLAIGSNAFTAAEIDRPVSVNVADDEDALLGLEATTIEETTAESNESLEGNETDATTDGNDNDGTTGNATDDETNSTAAHDENTVCQLEVTVTNQFPHAIDDVTVEVVGDGESFDLAVGESETATFEVDDPGDEVDVVVTVEDERVSVDLTRSVATDECSG